MTMHVPALPIRILPKKSWTACSRCAKTKVSLYFHAQRFSVQEMMQSYDYAPKPTGTIPSFLPQGGQMNAQQQQFLQQQEQQRQQTALQQSLLAQQQQKQTMMNGGVGLNAGQVTQPHMFGSDTGESGLTSKHLQHVCPFKTPLWYVCVKD